MESASLHFVAFVTCYVLVGFDKTRQQLPDFAASGKLMVAMDTSTNPQKWLTQYG